MSLPIEIQIKILDYALHNIDYSTYKMVIKHKRDIIESNSLIYNENVLTEALETKNDELMLKIIKKYTKYKDILNFEYAYYRKLIFSTKHIALSIQLYRMFSSKDTLTKKGYSILYNMIIDKMDHYNAELFTKLNYIF